MLGWGKETHRRDPRRWNQTDLSSNLPSSPSLQCDLDTVLKLPSLRRGLLVSLWPRTWGEELGFIYVVTF